MNLRRQTCLGWLLLWAGMLSAVGAEKKFDFSEAPTNQPPPGCSNLVAGQGKPGDWRVILDDVPQNPSPFSTNGAMAKKSVVAQLARDTTDEHYPMLVLGNENYDNFTFRTRFKLVDGQVEQMAGVAFHIQDEKNFCVARASALGNSVWFYAMQKGVIEVAQEKKTRIETGVWHELSVQCDGAKTWILLDGQEVMNVDQPTFSSGKIAFWTKSDSVSYFTDARIIYTPKEPFAQQLVRDAMKEYPRLLGVQVFATATNNTGTRIIASNNSKEIGREGEDTDADVIKRAVNYYQKKKDVVIVTMPLCDRNGDPMAAVRVLMKPTAGQTQENALIRAQPVVKLMQQQAVSVKSLVD
jgi:hypothetical protein